MKDVAVKSFAKSVTTTATRLVTTVDAKRMVQNAVLFATAANGAIVYVGGADVTTANGFPLAAGAALNLGDVFFSQAKTEIDLYNIWVIAASGTQELRVIHDNTVNS
jgi:hypothetical protein